MLDSLVRVSRRVGWNHNQTRRKLERAPQDRQPAAETCAQAARQGERSSQTASHASEQLPPALLAETPRERHRSDGAHSKDNSRVANNGSPEGLETERAPKDTPRPNLPTASTPRRTRSRQTGKHDPRAARKPITRSREVATSYWRSRTSARAGPSTTADSDGQRQSIPKETTACTATRHRVTVRSGRPEISSFELRQFHSFTPERFHALLNSLFRVLFNFPSRYLFAIGLVVVFSLWWSLPPTLGCTLKQPDSRGRAAPTCRAPVLRALHPLWARGNRIRSNLDVGVRKHGAKVTLP